MSLKDRTLKNLYERAANRENDRQLVEAGLDPAKLREYSNALAKLDNLVPDQATMLNKAIADAKQDLNNYIQGGFKQTVKGFFSDPVAKAVNFANAIRAGMANLPVVAKGFLPKGSEQETQKSMMELVPQEKQQQLIAIISKAFGKLPYVSNVNAAVQEMLQNTNPQGLFRDAQQIAATPQIPEPQKAPQNGQASPTPSPKSGSPTVATTSAAPTQAATAAKPAIAPTPSKVQPSTNRRLKADQDASKIGDIAYFLASQAGVDKEAAAKIIQALAQRDGLMDIQVPARPSNKLAANAPPEPAKT